MRPGDADAPELSDTALDIVLPALARTTRPALAAFAEPCNRILTASGPGHRRPRLRTSPDLTVETDAGPVPLPADLPRALASMEKLVLAVRATSASEPDLLSRPEVAPVLRTAYAGMARAAVREGGIDYLVSRYGLLVERDGKLALDLAREPVMAAVAAMDAARSSWDGAQAEWERHRALWETADPRHLFPNLLARDRERRYDDEKRLVHLELVLRAIIPNLIDTVTIAIDGLLEMAATAPHQGVVRAVVALRQENDLNRLVAGEDEAFALRAAPLHIVVFASAERATLMHVAFKGGKLETTTRPLSLALR